MEELFRMYYRSLCIYALHYLNDPSCAEDIVQECFASYWKRMQSGAKTDSPKSYLFSSVRNRCLDALRKNASIPGEVSSSALMAGISDEEEQERAELEAMLWTAVGRLPEGRRKMLIMSKRDGMKYSDIARSLGVSERTVRNQISRALKTLREGAKKLYLLIIC